MSHAHHADSKNHWEKELEKQSLKEAPFKGKLFWTNALTHLHSLEFKGKVKNYFLKNKRNKIGCQIKINKN